MRRCCAFVALAVLFATAPSAEEARGPRIRVEPESFDFGRVLPRRTLRKVFRLRNLGDETLVIERISRSCGCTEAGADASTLEPGKSASLRVVVETRAASGTIEREVLVRSNDPVRPVVEIRIRATVVDKAR